MFNSIRSTVIAISAGVVLLLGLGLAYKHYSIWEDRQNAKVATLEASAKALTARADSTARVADSLRANASKAARKAVEGEKTAPVLTPVSEIPVLCVKYVTEDRIAVDHWKQVAADWKDAFEQESEANDSLQSALNKQRAATDSALKASTEAQKKSLLSKLLPHPCVAGVVGVDYTGKPNAVVGIGFCKEF